MFALLLQSFRENYEYAKALDWISIIGLSFSILGLLVTIAHHLKIKWVFQTTSILMNKNPAWTRFLMVFLSSKAFSTSPETLKET